MANILSHEKRRMLLRLLCESNSIRGTSRVTDIDRGTVARVILQFGEACRNFLDERLRGLTLNHCEVDEIWTFVGKKQARLTVDEKAERADIGDVYLWTAVDAETKLIPTFVLGKRSADNARRFMVDLASRLVMPAPHATDPHAYQPAQSIYITQISTDGFPGYPEAVDLAFGPHARYGVIIKEYKNGRMQYDPSEIVGTRRQGVRGLNFHEERSICTSHVERNNLTIRTFMKRFARLSLGFSKKLECLEAACAMYVAYYNFVWRTRYPDKSGKAGRRRPPAAMLAKVTDHLWNFDELYDTVIQYG